MKKSAYNVADRCVKSENKVVQKLEKNVYKKLKTRVTSNKKERFHRRFRILFVYLHHHFGIVNL